MTKDELEQNLGTIAKSGSLDFKQNNQNENIDIIGQFGVGFYSAFMVASRVSVISRAVGSEEAFKWESSGADGYTITPAEKEEPGTEIILVIKDNTDDENYDNYLEEYSLAVNTLPANCCRSMPNNAYMPPGSKSISMPSNQPLTVVKPIVF